MLMAGNNQLPEALALLYRNAGPVTRRRALKKASVFLQAENKKRIKANVEPDGSPMAARLPFTKQGVRRFAYTNGQKQRSIRTVINGRENGRYFEGFDQKTKSIRRFRLDRMREAKPTKKSLRMFPQFWKFVERRSAGNEEVGFYEHKATRAREYQNGAGYVPRELLGISAADVESIKRILLDALTENTGRRR
ncbi:hypothetical protein SAMN02745130_02182 [Thiothrix eikelboomii]|uniref:Phage virion morphogenesis (Putative tail completion) protein n=1 Tax=Thiothrix eikelboomii TaxID=92487 RepID=A0A1T4WWJ1_9GAMM|nr:hypothetical protein [Thiothrix eikelboomii]SKA81245.1 hypothetical protein SAMN02745130_02182 [Thiothrix eikelboomii]